MICALLYLTALIYSRIEVIDIWKKIQWYAKEFQIWWLIRGGQEDNNYKDRVICTDN